MLAKSRGCIEKLRAGLVTLKVSVHDKSPTDTFGKVRASHLRQVLGNAAIWSWQDITKGTRRKHGGVGAHGEISVPTHSRKEKSEAAMYWRKPESFAHAQQVQSLYSLSMLSKCINFNTPLVLAHHISWALSLSIVQRKLPHSVPPHKTVATRSCSTIKHCRLNFWRTQLIDAF